MELESDYCASINIKPVKSKGLSVMAKKSTLISRIVIKKDCPIFCILSRRVLARESENFLVSVVLARLEDLCFLLLKHKIL